MEYRHKDILLLHRIFSSLLSIGENSKVKSLVMEGTLVLLKKVLPEASAKTDCTSTPALVKYFVS